MAESEGTGMGMMIGILVVVLVVIMLVFFGARGFGGRGAAPTGGGTSIQVPDKVDVNVNEGTGQ